MYFFINLLSNKSISKKKSSPKICSIKPGLITSKSITPTRFSTRTPRSLGVVLTERVALAQFVEDVGGVEAGVIAQLARDDLERLGHAADQ